MSKETAIIPLEKIAQTILVLRGEKVILDSDLAELYGVNTKALNQAVKRNQKKFPEDFMFQLTPEEKQEVVTNCDHLTKLKYSPQLPYAFTEHGAIMAANVLNSEKASEMCVFVVRTFVKLRNILASNKELARKLDELENRVTDHDKLLSEVIQAIRQLMAPPEKPKRQIGFQTKVKR